MRHTFSHWITEKAQQDDRIILIVGDIGYGLFEGFQERFPNRFYNFGLCEQSMISASAGLSLEGLLPYVYTITPFLIERPFEQIKIDIDQQNVNVTLVGYADYPDQGITHAEMDAPYLMRIFKNIALYFPEDSEGTRKVLDISYLNGGPAFVSLKKGL